MPIGEVYQKDMILSGEQNLKTAVFGHMLYPIWETTEDGQLKEYEYGGKKFLKLVGRSPQGYEVVNNDIVRRGEDPAPTPLYANGYAPDAEGDSLLGDLDKSFAFRLEQSKAEREADRLEAQERAQEQMPIGSLGRISEELDPAYLKLLEAREAQAAQSGVNLDEVLAMQRNEISRSDTAYQDLIQGRTDDSPEMIAAREKMVKDLQRQTTGRLRDASVTGREMGVQGGGLQSQMSRQAMYDEMNARGDIERQLLLGNLEAREQLVKDAANQRAANIGQLANLQISGSTANSENMARAEALRTDAQNQVLQRQLLNLEALRQEKYGQLGIEELGVQMGVAERSGLRQELVSEAAQAESARHAREMEEIQRIEAEKPPPSGGGGKSIMCVAYWQHGYMSDEVLKADFEYCEREIDEDTRCGYFFITEYLAHKIINSPKDALIVRLFRPMTIGWATEMAYREGVVEKGSLIGKAMCLLGVPLCRGVGKLKTLLSTTKEVIRMESTKDWLAKARKAVGFNGNE